MHGDDSRAFPGLQAFQAGIGHSDGFKREIVFPDAMLGQKRTGRQRDTVPRRGQGDRLALEVGIGSDLRPGDQAVGPGFAVCTPTATASEPFNTALMKNPPLAVAMSARPPRSIEGS